MFKRPTSFPGFATFCPSSCFPSQVIDDDEHFSVTIDVSQFAPEDLKVSVADGMVIIEGKHPLTKDQFGEVSTFFVFFWLMLNFKFLEKLFQSN